MTWVTKTLKGLKIKSRKFIRDTKRKASNTKIKLPKIKISKTKKRIIKGATAVGGLSYAHDYVKKSRTLSDIKRKSSGIEAEAMKEYRLGVKTRKQIKGVVNTKMNNLFEKHTDRDYIMGYTT